MPLWVLVRKVGPRSQLRWHCFPVVGFNGIPPQENKKQTSPPLKLAFCQLDESMSGPTLLAGFPANPLVVSSTSLGFL